MARPVIGKYWRPSWFERRNRDGAYAALNPAVSGDALLLQRALLPQPSTKLAWRPHVAPIFAATATLALLLGVNYLTY